MRQSCLFLQPSLRNAPSLSFYLDTPPTDRPCPLGLRPPVCIRDRQAGGRLWKAQRQRMYVCICTGVVGGGRLASRAGSHKDIAQRLEGGVGMETGAGACVA